VAALSTGEIDRELESRSKEVAAMSTTLIELDSHPGLEHMRRYLPTGVTAQRWAVVKKSLAELWEDLGRMTSIVESARIVRARRSKLTDADRAELMRLLHERALEVSRQRIPLAKRHIAGPRETVECVGLADTADRMHAAYAVVAEFAEGVDEINSLVATRLAPWQKRLDDAGASGPAELAELLAVSATDPLSLRISSVEERVAAIADSIQRRSDELAELAGMQANWPGALAAAADRLEALRDATLRAVQARTRAERMVQTGPLPAPTDAEPGLRSELRSIGAPDPAALRALRSRIEAGVQAARADEQLAQGLLDRRSELKGRLTAFQAKAARLGLGEDRDVMASGRIAAGLLSRRPCDLCAATRAITDFQQMIAEKRGTTE